MNVKSGAVVAIPVGDDQYQLAHVWALTLANRLALVAVYGEWTGAVNVTGDPELLALVTKNALASGHWKVVATVEAPSPSRFPVYGSIINGVPSVVTIDLDEGERRHVSSRRYRRLPSHSFVTPDALEWAIRAKRGLQDWSPYYPMEKLEPRKGLTESDWF